VYLSHLSSTRGIIVVLLCGPQGVKKEAEVRMTIMQRQAEQEKLNKAKRQQDKEDMRIQKQLELEQRKDERERLKKEREEEKAKEQAEQQRKKAEKEAANAAQAAQQVKRKPPQAPHPKNKRQKQSGAGASKVAAPEVGPAPPSRITHEAAMSHFQVNSDTTN
jgi:hypothetical protein